MCLIGKIKIEGSIALLSGLHIGGSPNTLDIGSIDNQVIKTSQRIPYIPGSSLKGKLRNMLARAAGSEDVQEDIELLRTCSDIKYIAKLFGIPETNGSVNIRAEAHLKIQDCFLINGGDYIEVKNENSITRMTGDANPRQLERVVPGAEFSLNLIMDVYLDCPIKDYLGELALAIKLLELDHLGGGGSRGNGKVKFHISKTTFYKIEGLEIKTSSECFTKELSEFSKTINTVL